MNVFKSGWSTWRRPLKKISLFFRRIKWAWQRITKGYCDYDVWDIDYYLSNLLWHILEDFSNTTNTFPNRFETYENWIKYIKEVSNNFRLTLEDEYPTPCLDNWSDNLPEGWPNVDDELDSAGQERAAAMREESKNIWQSRINNKNSGLEALSEVWFDLWD